jgi:hypothetical protein
MTDQERFDLACSRTMAEGMASIGTQKERLLHRTLKYYLEPDESRHEVPVNGYIADIFDRDAGQIWEIQTAGFDRLRGKLAAFLPDYTVTVVLPILRNKYLCWIHPDTGEVLSRRKSPRPGRATDILPEIYRLPQVQTDPHLRFCAALLDAEEYRLKDGWSYDGKRGSHRMERSPLSAPELVFLSGPADYQAILPDLPPTFTRKELSKALRLSPTKTGYAVTALERSGAIRRIGSEGRAYLYERTNLA